MNTDARRLDHRTLGTQETRCRLGSGRGEPRGGGTCHGRQLADRFLWLALYRSGGWDKLDARKRGGCPPKLEAGALRWVYDTVLGKSPLQLKFPFALWTAAMVHQFIAKRFGGVHLSHSSVCRLLAQMGMSAQRPLW